MVGVSYDAALALALGYLLGSIPFGLVLTRLAGAGDLRAIGSGNIGATNVLRTGRKDLAAATLLLDALKATAAVLVGVLLFGPVAGLPAAAGAFIGHLYPVWLGFRGGKGVATFLGGLIGVAWPAAARLRRRLARGRLVDPLFLGRRAGGDSRLADRRLGDRPSRGRDRVCAACGARLVQAQRQHPTAARR